jgi:NitT/TauT family transport system substrate-binding protein
MGAGRESMLRRTKFNSAWITLLVVMTLIAAACGGDDGEAGDTGGGEDSASVRMVFPVDSPILYGFRVADEVGYYEDEGVEPDFTFAEGGAEAITQLIAGNADIALVPVGNVVEALEEGSTDLRAPFNIVYASIFFLAVPEDSPIESAADLEGAKIGISAQEGGEVPIIGGILRSAGLNEEDADLIAVGAGTALAVRALESGQVDAIGGSVNDIIAVEVQLGDRLRAIVPEELAELPSSGIVVTQQFIDENGDILEGFLRATSKGYYWGQASPEATLALLKKVTPEQFTDATGERIFEATIPITWAPEGTQFGAQSPESWAEVFDFVGAEPPDVELSTVVTQELVDPANDYDEAEVAADAEGYEE